jgi:periodic tryptophan protein 2
MRFGYRLSRLLGSVHGNANLVFVPPEGTSVLSAVRNRVMWVDLVNHASSALPFECRKDVRLMAVSHDGRLLLVIDDDGRALLVNLQRRVVLHRLNFKHRVRAAAFSPSDGFIAVAVGKSVQVWRTPGRRHQFSPLVLHKTYGGQSDDITCLDWAPDDCHLLAGSRDMTARVYYINDAGYNKVTSFFHEQLFVTEAYVQ